MIGAYPSGPMEIPLSNAKSILTDDVVNELRLKLGVKIEVKPDSVVVSLVDSANPEYVLKIRQIIDALSLGFSKYDALELIDSNKYLDVIDLGEYVNKDKANQLTRIKALIIGEGGSVKRNIENLAGVKMIVKDKVVGIIGEYENVRAARDAVMMIIRGKQHSTVYRWLQRWRRELSIRRIESGQ